jgi:hypothetical protein
VLREQIVSALARTLGPEDDSTLNAEWKLAMCLATLDRPEEAGPLLAHVVAGRTLALGPDDPETLSAMAWSATVARRNGRLEEARTLQEQVVAGYESNGTQESPHGLQATLNLASTLIELGQLDESTGPLRVVLDARRRILGDEDPKTQDVLSVLASVLAQSGRDLEARALANEPADGPAHSLEPDTAEGRTEPSTDPAVEDPGDG